MKYLTGSIVITIMMVLQSHLVLADDTKVDKGETRYQLPSVSYDDSVGQPEGREKLMSSKQMAISRAIKRAKQRRIRIAMQKLSGRSISRPNYSYRLPNYHSSYHRILMPYYGVPWHPHNQIHFRTSFE